MAGRYELVILRSRWSSIVANDGEGDGSQADFGCE